MDARGLTDALEALERNADDQSAFCRPFVELFPVSGASVSTVGALLGSETLSASDSLAARVDELQFDLGEGPCWDAMNGARPVLEPDLRNNPRSVWPAFSAAIRDQPVGSLFAFPLRFGSLRIGAVDLYSTTPMDLTPTQSKQAMLVADAVGKHVLRRALEGIGGDADEPLDALSRRLIHQATGMVLAQLRIPADDARLIVQGHAFATGVTMMSVAKDIVERRLEFRQGESGIEAVG
jgi:GAF domain-containing protein